MAASNIIVGTNPAFAATDLYAIYPQFNTSAIPVAVINAYIALASASIMQARWQSMWQLAMCNFVAHYLTLWLMAQTPVGSSAAQIATAGLAQGISTSQSAGDASYSVQPVVIDGAGTWNLTLFGQQLATQAMALGTGMMLIY
jgi:hypothetical protein